MRPAAADATSGTSSTGSVLSANREPGSRKSSSKRSKRLRPHLSDGLAPSPTDGSISGSSSCQRTPAAAIVLNMSSSVTSGTNPISSAKEQVTGSNVGASGNKNSNKQPVHSGTSTSFHSPFGRFSLRRLLNPVNLTRTAMATTAAAVSSGSGRTSSSGRAIPVIDSVTDAVRVSFFHVIAFPGRNQSATEV